MSFPILPGRNCNVGFYCTQTWKNCVTPVRSGALHMQKDVVGTFLKNFLTSQFWTVS
jgi:hypothetical protein